MLLIDTKTIFKLNEHPHKNTLIKDLILRERLAIERTAMVIDTTLLAFIRTALYFSIGGMSLNSLIKVSYGLLFEIAFWVMAAVIRVTGIFKFFEQKKA